LSAGVDYDLLADYVGGALEGTADQERVARLIAASAEWGDAADELMAALRGVQNDLNLLRQTAEPMPEDVAARFEGLFDGTRRDPLEPRLVTRRSAGSGTARAKRWKRWAAPAAVVAAALGFFAFSNVPALMPSPNSGNRSTAELSDAAPGAAPQQAAVVPTTTSGRMYDRNSLQDAPPGWMAPGTDSSYRTSAKADAAVPLSAQLGRFIDPGALAQCLNAVGAAQPGRVNFVDFAYFEGSPALVISITSSTGQVWFVAGANCGQTGPDERYRTPPK
jgi:hypothetical protein